MDGKEMTRLVRDSNVSDGSVFDALLQFCADPRDEAGNLRAPTPEELQELELVSGIVEKERPVAYRMFGDWFRKNFHCSDPSCGNREKHE